MSKNDAIALILVLIGLLAGIALTYSVPVDKLTLALSIPTAIVGAGLTRWQGK